MSARTGWKRDAEGRMLRSLSCEVIMSDEQPSMLLDKVPAHVLRELGRVTAVVAARES